MASFFQVWEAGNFTGNSLKILDWEAAERRVCARKIGASAVNSLHSETGNFQQRNREF
jgi:hypothetical protein